MSHKLRLLTETLVTSIGNLMVISDEIGRLRAVDWIDYDDRMRRLLARHYGKDNVTLIPASRSSGHVDLDIARLRIEHLSHIHRRCADVGQPHDRIDRFSKHQIGLVDLQRQFE